MPIQAKRTTSCLGRVPLLSTTGPGTYGNSPQVLFKGCLPIHVRHVYSSQELSHTQVDGRFEEGCEDNLSPALAYVLYHIVCSYV